MCCRGEPEDLKMCHQILRWTMFGVNLIIFVISAVMMGYAVYLIDSEWELLAYNDNIIPIIMFVAFGVTMVVTAIGALGACNLSRGFLAVYICVTILCLAMEVTLIVLIIVNNYDTQEFIQSRWNDLTNNDKAWLEESFKCCGLDADDPDTFSSQCGDTAESTSTSSSSSPYPFCLDELEHWVADVKTILLAIGIGLLLFQIGGTVVSVLLLRALKNSERARDDSYIDLSYYNNNV